MESALTAAIDLHQTGQLAPAAQLHRQVLLREPDNADALHLYGVLVHQQGDPRRALELIDRAVALRPDSALMVLLLRSSRFHRISRLGRCRAGASNAIC
jgi:predicted Zn-dependent protease